MEYTFSARPGGKGEGITGDKAHHDIPRPPVPPGLKPKDLVGIPWRVAFALQADGWYLRNDVPWIKKNPMPESVRDRMTRGHEYMFLFSKSKKYFYDKEAVAKPAKYPKDDRKPYAPGRVDSRGNGHDRNGGQHTGRDAGHRPSLASRATLLAT